MIEVLRVVPDDTRILAFENLIYPKPERWLAGHHYLFIRNQEPIGYMQLVPIIWIGGELIPVALSHWVYVARLSFTRPQFLAPAFRAFYKQAQEFLFPLSLIAKPTPGHSEVFNTKLGYAPDKWLNNFWTLHCKTPEELPLFGARRDHIDRRHMKHAGESDSDPGNTAEDQQQI